MIYAIYIFKNFRLHHLYIRWYMPSNMFIFQFWTTFLGQRKIHTKFFSVNACCELKSRLFDFFNRFQKCASWVQILFNYYNLVVSTSNFLNMWMILVYLLNNTLLGSRCILSLFEISRKSTPQMKYIYIDIYI